MVFAGNDAVAIVFLGDSDELIESEGSAWKEFGLGLIVKVIVVVVVSSVEGSPALT